MHVPQMLRQGRVLVTLAILGVGSVVLAPATFVPMLPYLLILVCPLMMVFMMGSMHRTSSSGPGHEENDPYSLEALKRRLAQLDAERATINGMLENAPSDRRTEIGSSGTSGNRPWSARSGFEHR